MTIIMRSGMKTENGTIVRYFEAMKDKDVKLVVNGEKGTVSRVDVMDADIKTASGVKIGTPFSDLYQKAFGVCEKATGDDAARRSLPGAEQPAHQLSVYRRVARAGRIDAVG